jgi:hypothetical protein
MFAGAIGGGRDAFWGFVAGLCAAFLALFMAKVLAAKLHA